MYRSGDMHNKRAVASSVTRNNGGGEHKSKIDHFKIGSNLIDGAMIGLVKRQPLDLVTPSSSPISSWVFVLAFVLFCYCGLIISPTLNMIMMKLRYSFVENGSSVQLLYSKTENSTLFLAFRDK